MHHDQAMGWGVDRDPGRRPGVPAEQEPPRPAAGAAWTEPPAQHAGPAPGRRRTPVYGTAQPLHGVSGVVRRLAYRAPDHQVRHWMLLLLADRLEVAGSRVREEPARALAVAAVLVGGLLLVRGVRGRRRS